MRVNGYRREGVPAALRPPPPEFFCVTFSPSANLMPGSAPGNSISVASRPYLSFSTAFCPPIVFAEPCRRLIVVTPPASARRRNNEQIHRGNVRRVVTQERSPFLARR